MILAYDHLTERSVWGVAGADCINSRSTCCNMALTTTATGNQTLYLRGASGSGILNIDYFVTR